MNNPQPKAAPAPAKPAEPEKKTEGKPEVKDKELTQYQKDTLAYQAAEQERMKDSLPMHTKLAVEHGAAATGEALKRFWEWTKSGEHSNHNPDNFQD